MFGLFLFLSIALFRGMSLGQSTNPIYLIISSILAILFGVWLFLLNRKQKQGRKTD